MTSTPRAHLQTVPAQPDSVTASSRLITAIDTGLVMTVEPVDPGHEYDVRLLAFTDATTLDELASRRIAAPSASAALHDMAAAEQHAGGLNAEEASHFHDQINHLAHTAARSAPGPTPHPAGWAAVSPETRWRDVVAATAGPAVTRDGGYPALAAGLDRAVATGWDWATDLPQLVAAPLPDRHAAAELYYRLLDTHPAAYTHPARRSARPAPPPGQPRHPAAPTTAAPTAAAPTTRSRPGQPRSLTTQKGTAMSSDPATTIIGNLTADPELRYTTTGAAVTTLTIAATPRRYDKTSNRWVDGDTLFIRATLWRDTAEHAAESLHRGDRVLAHGTLQQRSYEDRSGINRTTIELATDDIGPSLRYATTTVHRASRGTTASDDDQDVSANGWKSEPVATN